MIRVSELKQAEINIVFHEKEKEKTRWSRGTLSEDIVKESQEEKHLKERMRQTLSESGGG